MVLICIPLRTSKTFFSLMFLLLDTAYSSSLLLFLIDL